MKRKGKTKKETPPRLSLTPEQESLVMNLVEGFQDKTPDQVAERVPDPLCAQRLIERLPPHESTVPLLLTLKDRFPEKHVAKAIKRTLFKLQKKGVSTEAFYAQEDDPSPILRPVPKEPPLCYVGPINAVARTRAVALILHRGGKGCDTGLGLVSETEGFLEFFFQRLSKKEAKALTGQFSDEAGPLVETTLAHAATILEEAYQRQASRKAHPPRDYIELRPWLLKHAAVLQRPIIYDMIPETLMSGLILTDAAVRDLFDDPLMESWLIEPDAIKPFMEEMSRVNESPLLLTPLQKSARIREIQDKCLAAVFTADERKRLKGGLEEMAYLFLKLGQEETAKVALAAAQTTDQEVTVLKSAPVMETLLQRSLALYTDAVEEGVRNAPGKTDAPSPIIMP